jgi:hypothetical protein
MNNRLLVSTFIFLSSFVVAQEIAWQQTLGGAREDTYEPCGGRVCNKPRTLEI